MKRVFKTVEEMQGSVVKNVCKLFLLPEPLARYIHLYHHSFTGSVLALFFSDGFVMFSDAMGQ